MKLKALKKQLKRLIGEQRINFIRGYINYIKIMPRVFRNEQRIKISNGVRVSRITLKNKHVFCGYFDISPDCPTNANLILVHVLDKNAIPGKSKAAIALADVRENKVMPLAYTSAWSWQMGARARWGKEKNTIYFNDYIDGTYVCRKFDIEKKKDIKQIPFALYDISCNEKYGVTINFDRLQRLRPGYGYSNKPDNTVGKINPEDEGLFLVDIEDGTAELLVSFEELDKKLPVKGKGETYINHISFSPDGNKVMFFYIWVTAEAMWKATLWIVDIQTKICHCLESNDQVSHYDWKDNNTLLITGFENQPRKAFYRYYDVVSGKRCLLDSADLEEDGHPSFSRVPNKFYSDTYPDAHCKQEVFQFEDGCKTELAMVFHDPRMSGEKRCDLHPHYYKNKEALAIDTTFMGGVRSVLILDLEDL